jgi:hypothetical protein
LSHHFDARVEERTAILRRYLFSLGAACVFAAGLNSSPVHAQELNPTGAPTAPSSCTTFAQATTLVPLRSESSPWGSPECAAHRAAFEKEQTAATVATVAGATSDSQYLRSSSILFLSNGTSTGAQKVDNKGLAFVTDGLAHAPVNVHAVWLPKGTLFPVHTMQSYSTFEALPNGKMRLELDQDIVVNGFLVAMKGDTAEGSFPTTMSGRNFFFVTISGSLFQISIDTIYSYCGDKIDVNFDRTEYRSARIGPFHSDMDQHIIRGQEYVSFTSRPQTVCGVPTVRTNAVMPPTALYPTTH